MDIRPKQPPATSQLSPVLSHHSPAPSPEPNDSFRTVLNRLAHQVDQGERVVNHALRGNPYGNDDRGMIALQAGVYRYVEAVDLSTKLVDRSANAVRTTLQNQ